MIPPFPDAAFPGKANPLDGDRSQPVVIEGDFEPVPLRCPACGIRGRVEDGGSLWLTVGIRVGPDGLPTMVLAPDPRTVEVDCARCDHTDLLPSFLQPLCVPTETPTTSDGRTWPALPEGIAPLLLTDEVRAVEAAWAIAALTP